MVIAVAVAALAAMLALAALAGANGVKSGKTKLKPDVDTFEALADMGISVETTGAAEFLPTGAKFPVFGGDIDPSVGYWGQYGHKGGLLFSRSDGASVKFKHLSINIHAQKGRMFATANGNPLKLAEFKITNLAGTDTSFQFKNAEATLAKDGAGVLSRTFDFDFNKGIPLGTITTKATISRQQVEE
jgi:hypothetical protein